MHLKRQKSHKSWPIYRKGTKYVVRPVSGIKNRIPLLIVLRDLLKLAQNKKEVKRALHMKNIKVNNKTANEEKTGLFLFDTINIIPLKKAYRIEILENGKIGAREIKENEADFKISKISNKKILKGKKIQLNMNDGNNFISDIKCNTNDSAVISFSRKKIERCIPLREKSKVFVFSGKHAGKTGHVLGIDGVKKMAEVEIDKQPINILIKQIIAVE